MATQSSRLAAAEIEHGHRRPCYRVANARGMSVLRRFDSESLHYLSIYPDDFGWLTQSAAL